MGEEKLTKEELRLKLLKLKYGDRLKTKADDYGLTEEQVRDTMKDETEPTTNLGKKIKEAKQKKEQRDRAVRPPKGRK